jgi:hypothetical protein
LTVPLIPTTLISMSIPSPEIIETTIQALQEHLYTVEEERNKIDKKIAGINAAIVKWRAALQETEQENGVPPTDLVPRHRKGENPQLVKSWFESHPGAGFTIPEITTGTGLPHGSVYGVMNGKKSRYKKDEDGRWWLKNAEQDKKNEGDQPSLTQ